jgi:hypothetical protein
MSLLLKVYGGTTSENLCLKCQSFREIQGIRDSDTIRRCGAQKDNLIPFPVARCSYYREKDPDLKRYRGALELTFDKKKKKLLVITSHGLFNTKYQTVEEYRAECVESDPLANVTAAASGGLQ